MFLFSRKAKQQVRASLKYIYKDSRSMKWLLKEENLLPLAKEIVKAVVRIENNQQQDGVEILKQMNRRIIFRIKSPGGSDKTYIAKYYFLTSFLHRFKSRRYGFVEAANMLTAGDRGIKTPKLYGYGHIYGLLGFVKASVIIMEDLFSLLPVKQLLNKAKEQERSRIFMRTIPVFISLYKAGCNHIDVNRDAIVLSQTEPDEDVFLLDFQYSRFYSKPSPEILIFEAGYFADSCRPWITQEIVNEWLNKLLAAADIHNTEEIQRLKERFDYYYNNPLSRKLRQRVV